MGYTLNRDKIRWLSAPFLNTLDSVMEIVTTVDEVGMVILFGSCSKGTQTENSDIDLLVLLDSDKSGMPFKRLEEKVGIAIYDRYAFDDEVSVELLFADVKDYINSINPRSVYQRIKKDGVVLYE